MIITEEDLNFEDYYDDEEYYKPEKEEKEEEYISEVCY